MKLRAKKIKFISIDPGLHVDPPRAASKFLPSWYRKLEPVIDGVETIKKCVPFLDSMTSGYMVTLAADVYFNGEGFEQVSKRGVVSEHILDQVKDISLPDEYSGQPYKWINMFSIKTPKGYSTMFSHPFNRLDLPFYSLGGIVDTDTFPVPVNFPFFIRKDFKGVIPAGTPIAQAFPFKRTDWSMDLDDQSGIEVPIDYFIHANPPFNYYKRKFWKRKRYS
jgi:hypothetical protein